jgi:hypothetical protein
MKLENFYVGVSLFVLIFSLLAVVYGESIGKYNIQDYNSSSFSRVTAKAISLDNTQQQLQDKLANQKTSENNALDNMVQGGYLALQSIMGSFGIVGDLITAVGTEMHFISPSIIGWVIGLLAVVLFITILYIIMKVR